MLWFDLFQNLSLTLYKALQVLPNSSKMWKILIHFNMLVTELIIFVYWNILCIYLFGVYFKNIND
jgi:hypothetical protein